MRRLNIGGTEKKDGWEILNIKEPADHVCDAGKLDFEDNTFEIVYASHILEHFPIANVQDVLKEWVRVAKDEFYISVPDLSVLSRMLVREDFSQAHPHILRVIYGGQTNEYDFHKSGFTRRILERLLTDVGLKNIERVKEFGFFDDASRANIGGVPISINLKAGK